MNLEQIDRILTKICAGGKFVRVTNGFGEHVYLLIKEPTLQDRLWADFIYEQALADGKARNLLPSSELLSLYKESGVWSDELDKELKGLQTVIDELEKQIKNPETSRSDIHKMNKLKRVTEEKLIKLKARKHELFSTSLEQFADSERIKAIVFCATHTAEGKKYWPTWKDFENETDNIFISSIIDVLSECFATVETPIIRKIARSGAWRVMWQASKNSSDNLFGKPLVYLTRNQESLIYWSQVYDAAYESYERPSDDIINDDEALDKWFEEQSSKRKQQDALKPDKNKYGLSSRISRHGEIGIVANPYINKSAPDISEVYDLNDPLAKKFIGVQNARIKKAGVISEQELRSDKDSRRVIGAKDAITHKARGRDGFTRRVVDKVLPGGTISGKKG